MTYETVVQSLTYTDYIIPLYAVKSVLSILILINLFIAGYVWLTVPGPYRFHACPLFTLHLAFICFLNRLVFLVYYILQIMVAQGRYIFSQSGCRVLSRFLFITYPSPISACILFSSHALVGVIAPTFYATRMNPVIGVITVVITHALDLIIGLLGAAEVEVVRANYNISGLNETVDNCMFDFYNRFSNTYFAPYVNYQLYMILVLWILHIVLGFACAKRNWGLENPVCDSPVYIWFFVSWPRRIATVAFFLANMVLYNMHGASQIIWLQDGNNYARQILEVGYLAFLLMTPSNCLWHKLVTQEKLLKFLCCGRKVWALGKEESAKPVDNEIKVEFGNENDKSH